MPVFDRIDPRKMYNQLRLRSDSSDMLNFPRLSWLESMVAATAISHVKLVALSTFLLVFPLLLWQRFHDSTNWAILSLLLLAWILYSGFRKPLLATLQARSRLESRSSSPASVFSSAIVTATAFSLLFVLLIVPILALQTLNSAPWTLLTMLVLCVTSSALVIWAPSKLTLYWNEPFATSRGIAVGSGLAAIIFFPILILLDLTLPSDECRSSSLWEWLQIFNPFRSDPERAWVTNILEPLLLIECTKRELVELIGDRVWLVHALYSLTYAAVTFVIAQAAAATTCFAKSFSTGEWLGGGEHPPN